MVCACLGQERPGVEQTATGKLLCKFTQRVREQNDPILVEATGVSELEKHIHSYTDTGEIRAQTQH